MNTSKMKVGKSFDIISGPSLQTVLDSLKYGTNPEAKIPIEFKVALGYTAPPSEKNAAYVPANIRYINVRGINREDLSEDSFKIYGVCQADLRMNQKIKFFKVYKFEALYNTRVRKGRITLFESCKQ